jgi:ketosteroid isomerase-like protein
MKHRFVLGIAALALVVTACTAAPAGLTPEDEAALRAAIESFDQATSAMDWDAVMEIMTEDFLQMPPNESVIEGRSAWRANVDSSRVTEKLEYDTEVIRVEGRGDLAFVYGTYSGKDVMEGVEELDEYAGSWLSIYRKQPDGSWLIAIDIFNSDLPLPE